MNLEQRIMSRLARLVTRFHRIIPVIGVVLVVLSMAAARNIRITTRMEDMLPFRNPQVQAVNEINRLFGGGTSLIITVEGKNLARIFMYCHSPEFVDTELRICYIFSLQLKCL
ncbi:MAG: hypothetical protein ACOC7U_00690 [Spirochaetota bacterium]